MIEYRASSFGLFKYFIPDVAERLKKKSPLLSTVIILYNVDYSFSFTYN